MKYSIASKIPRKLDDGIEVFQVKAERDIGDSVSAGDLGGWIQHPYNLDQKGDAWLDSESIITGDSFLTGNLKLIRSVIAGNSLLWSKASQFIQDCRLRSSDIYLNQEWALSAMISESSIIRCQICCGSENIAIKKSSLLGSYLFVASASVWNSSLKGVHIYTDELEIMSVTDANDQNLEKIINEAGASKPSKALKAVRDEFNKTMLKHYQKVERRSAWEDIGKDIKTTASTNPINLNF